MYVSSAPSLTPLENPFPFPQIEMLFPPQLVPIPAPRLDNTFAIFSLSLKELAQIVLTLYQSKELKVVVFLDVSNDKRISYLSCWSF